MYVKDFKLGLQLMTIFNPHLIKKKKCPLQFSKARADIFTLLVLSTSQFWGIWLEK